MQYSLHQHAWQIHTRPASIPLLIVGLVRNHCTVDTRHIYTILNTVPTLWSLWQKIPYPWHDRRITESEIPGLGKPVWDCSSQPLTNPPLLIVIIIAFFLAKIHPICHAILAKSTLSVFPV